MLVWSTTLFLAAPVALFFLGWLRPPLAAAAIVALAFAVGSTARRLDRRWSPGRDRDARWRVVTALAGVALLGGIVLTSGVAGFGRSTWDWNKHNAILADLVTETWPVVYGLPAATDDLALVYQLAYYLPSALVGRFLGWTAANYALAGTTVIGVILAWLWVARVGRTSLQVALVVVVLFGGLDLLGALVSSSLLEAADEPWWRQFHLEWWQGRFVYSNNITLVSYAPNQALGGWLATALSLEALRRGMRGLPLVLPIALCLAWSAFAALGLALVLGAYCTRSVLPRIGASRDASARSGVADTRRRRRMPSAVAAVAAAAVAAPLLLYFAARVPAPTLPADLVAPAAAAEAARLTFLPVKLGATAFAREWSRFLGFELLPLAAALAGSLWLAHRRARGAGRFACRLLASALVVLALVPAVSYGFYNDWAMRVSIPALFAVQVLTARTLSTALVPAAARAELALLLLIAGLHPLSQVNAHLRMIAERGQWVQPPPLGAIDDLFALQRGSHRHYGFLEQYVGSARAPFFRWLAPPLEPRESRQPPR